MAHIVRWLVVLTLFALSGIVAAPATRAAGMTSPQAAPVKVASTHSIGKILVTAHGMTLYYFTAEKNGTIACTGGCSKIWPPFLLRTGQTLRGIHGLPGKLGTMKRPDGSTQITYNGWPLYTYVRDQHPGQMLGQGVRGMWYVATLRLKARASSSTSGNGW
jgi:predicted lipoprotein with Yx(FWY)xxD motif